MSCNNRLNGQQQIFTASLYTLGTSMCRHGWTGRQLYQPEFLLVLIHRENVTALVLYGHADEMSESRQTHVTLHDIDCQALEQLVQYAYTAEIVVGEGNVQVEDFRFTDKLVQLTPFIKLTWCISTCNCPLFRPCSRPPACCSSTGCGTPAVSSSSASWTPPTAWASEASLTRTPAASCSSPPTSMSCSTLWRCPRRRSSCSCHWNR